VLQGRRGASKTCGIDARCSWLVVSMLVVSMLVVSMLVVSMLVVSMLVVSMLVVSMLDARGASSWCG